MNKKVTLNSFYASYVSTVDHMKKPDLFVFEQGELVTKPKSNFVISRNNTGEVLSVYGDEIWDLKPYLQGGNQNNSVLHFEKFPISNQEDAKWLMFILMFFVGTGKATNLSVSSLYGYMKPLRSMSVFAQENNITIIKIITQQRYLLAYVATISTPTMLKRFQQLMSHIFNSGSDKTGIKVLNINQIDSVKRKFEEFDDEEQTPVIPPRILSELVTQLRDFTDFVSSSSNILKILLDDISCGNVYFNKNKEKTTPNLTTQKKYMSFIDVTIEYELSNLFNKYGVNNWPNLSLFISRVQHAGRLLIATYSGMRAAETLSLKVGCLKKIEPIKGNIVYKIDGKTTKFNGQEVDASWVTSKEVENAICLCEMFALCAAKQLGLKSEDVPLFISPGYLGLCCAVKKDEYIRLSITGNKNQEVFNLFDVSKFIVQKNDFEHLKAVNEFRDWENDKEFGLNQIWRFKFHQLRRSLAFYVSQSGLVSLPSLKRQLKHLSREMTIYYCQSSNTKSNFSNDFMNLVSNIKPEADATAFLNDVIKSDERLWGAHGRFIDKHLDNEERVTLFTQDRKELEKRFKNGELAYNVTPLGACTRHGPCDQKAFREVTACLSCDKAVIKLSKLDNVINKQEQLVKDIFQSGQSSLIQKAEQNELDNLKKYREKIIALRGNL